MVGLICGSEEVIERDQVKEREELLIQNKWEQHLVPNGNRIRINCDANMNLRLKQTRGGNLTEELVK